MKDEFQDRVATEAGVSTFFFSSSGHPVIWCFSLSHPPFLSSLVDDTMISSDRLYVTNIPMANGGWSIKGTFYFRGIFFPLLLVSLSFLFSPPNAMEHSLFPPLSLFLSFHLLFPSFPFSIVTPSIHAPTRAPHHTHAHPCTRTLLHTTRALTYTTRALTYYTPIHPTRGHMQVCFSTTRVCSSLVFPSIPTSLSSLAQ